MPFALTYTSQAGHSPNDSGLHTLHLVDRGCSTFLLHNKKSRVILPAQEKLVWVVTRGKVAPWAFYFLALRQLVQVPVGAGLVYAGLKYGAASLAFYREIAGQCPCSEMCSLGFNNSNAAKK